MQTRFTLVLSEEDQALLENLQARLEDVSATEVLRWSLRFYALMGPWKMEGEKPLEALRGREKPLTIGPQQHVGGRR